MVERYVPDVGHVVRLQLDPQAEREQSERPPFLVLSPRAYNAKTSLSVGVPITTKRKGYPFEVPLKAGNTIAGVALADQIKSLGSRERFAEFIAEVSPATLRSVRGLLATFLELA